MFSPKELEGEVDHSFFDSDCEVDDPDKRKDNKSSVGGNHRSVEPSETESNSAKDLNTLPPTPSAGVSCQDKGSEDDGFEAVNVSEERVEDRVGAKDREEVEEDCGEEIQEEFSNEEKQRVEREEAGSRLGEEGKERGRDRYGSDKESLSSSAERPHVRAGSQSEDEASVHSDSSVEIHTDPSSSDEEELYEGNKDAVFDNNDGEEDGYHHSEEESEDEDERPPEPKPPKHRGGTQDTPKKSTRKFRNHSPSASSSSELESSYSSEEEEEDSYSSEPSSQRKPPVAVATSSPRRQQRSGLALRRDKPEPLDIPESEDTVTDVTPLSTPDNSPAQSFDLALGMEDRELRGVISWQQEDGAVARQQQHNVTVDLDVSAEMGGEQDDSDSEVLRSVEQRLSQELAISCPGARNRKNFSFTNEEVRQIDRENQRLLRELSRPSTRSRGGSSACSSSASGRRVNVQPVRLYHSAINRQREQQRIEKENLAFLKRLESVKPTPGMTRAEQLADYQRQARYLCTPLPISTYSRSPSKMDRPGSSRTSSGKSSRPCSASSRQGPRPSTAKPNRGTAPRPAWS